MFLDSNFANIARGWNDGRRMAITSDSLSSAVVEIHEATHGRIFSRTYDGQLHRLCVFASGTAYDVHHSGIFTKTSKLIFLDTKDAHEAAATYLAIQSLPNSGQRKEEFRSLPPAYKSYYRMLSDTIDPFTRTSWLRFAFAWTLIHWCFHSTRFTQFFQKIAPDINCITSTPSPSDRLLAVKDFLKKSNRGRQWIKTSVQQAKIEYESTGRKIWDINDENEWNKRGSQQDTQLFENILTSAAGDWLLKHVPYETSDFSDRLIIPGPGFDKLASELKMNITHIFTEPQSVLNKEWSEANIEHEANFHSADIITHDPKCSLTDLRHLSNKEIVDIFNPISIASLHCTILHDSAASNCLIVAFRSASSKVGANNFTDAGTFVISTEFGKKVAQEILLSNPDLSLRAIFKMSKEDVLKSALLAFSILYREDKTGMISLARSPDHILGYFKGPWIQTYSIPDIEIGSAKISFLDESGSLDKPMSLRLAKTKGLPWSHIITLKPNWSGYRLDKYEQILFAQNHMKSIDTSTLNIQETVMPLRDAWHIWKEF